MKEIRPPRRRKFQIIVFISLFCLVNSTSNDTDTDTDSREIIKTVKPDAETIKNLVAQEPSTTESQAIERFMEQQPTSHKASNYRRTDIAGTLGVNYQLDGNEPYLICAYLNRTECDPDYRSDCPTTKKCYLDNSHNRLACIGVYTHNTKNQENSTDSHIPVSDIDTNYLGCFNFKETEHVKSDCDETKCHAKTKRRVQQRDERSKKDMDSDKKELGFCCCFKNNCNQLGALKSMNPNYQGETEETIKNETDTINAILSFPHKDEDTTIEFLLGILMVVLAILIIAFCVGSLYFFTRKAMQKSKKSGQEPIELQNHRIPYDDTPESISKLTKKYTVAPQQWDPNEIGENTNLLLDVVPITDLKMIDHGRFGYVYRGLYTMENGETKFVAVKKHSRDEKASFESEKYIFEQLKKLNRWYPSILQYVDSFEVDDEYWLVTEYHERFSLYDLIKNNIISVASCVRIIVTMLDGLQFLHDERPFFFDIIKPMIIHRDIKSKNILVKSDMTTCIADFGLARKYDSANLACVNGLLAQVGTKRYMSPEVLEGATEYNSSAFKQMDVYGMALVMWEVISRTQIGENDVIGEYKLPYQEEVGMNPRIQQLTSLVHARQVRPKWRENVYKHKVIDALRKTAEEMWCPLAGNRITAGCAFDRAWNACLAKEEERKAPNRNGFVDNDEIQETQLIHTGLLHYHENPTQHPHPTDDPFLSQPLPPSPPEMPEHDPHLKENGSSSNSRYPEKHFDLDLGRRVTRDEAESRKRDVDENGSSSRTSTLTPDWEDFSVSSFINKNNERLHLFPIKH